MKGLKEENDALYGLISMATKITIEDWGTSPTVTIL
jgi:hypothetical protein